MKIIIILFLFLFIINIIYKIYSLEKKSLSIFESKEVFTLINQLILFELISIEYKDPKEFRKNNELSPNEKLFTNWLVTVVSSVGIDLIVSPLSLLKKKILFLWFAAIIILLIIFKLDLKGIL